MVFADISTFICRLLIYSAKNHKATTKNQPQDLLRLTSM